MHILPPETAVSGGRTSLLSGDGRHQAMRSFHLSATFIAAAPNVFVFRKYHAKLTSTGFRGGFFMRKRKGKKRDGKVILFPDFVRRSLEKGLECLQNKNYSQAVGIFEDTLSHSPDNRDVYIGLLLAYYESGMLQKAKEIAEEMLSKKIGDYLDTVELYMMVLVQLQEYEKLAKTIYAVLKEQAVPPEKKAGFAKMLEYANRMQEEKRARPAETEEERPTLRLTETKDPTKLVFKIAELSEKNAGMYIEEMKEYLRLPDGHPFLKTMLLNLLKEQGCKEKVNIFKFGGQKVVIPAELPDSNKSEQKLEIEKILQQQLENENPVLFAQIKGLLERQTFLLYPFGFTPEDPFLWAGAFHASGLSFAGGESDLVELARLYRVKPEELEKACRFIKELEKISFPVI